MHRVLAFLVFATCVCAARAEDCSPRREMRYGTASRLQALDFYAPAQRAASARVPLVVWLHGGGLRTGDKSAMPRRDFGPPPMPKDRDGPYQVQVPDVSLLCRSGYAVASLNYRLGASMAEAAPDAIADAKAAVRFLRRHAAQLHVDGTRIAAWGNSAGGYLVAMLAVTADEPSEAIQAAVIWFGAEDRLGRELNPATYVAHARRIPPVRIVNGDADPVVSAAQARRLHEALMRSGARSELVILAGAGHEDPQFSRTQMQPTLAFLASALRR